MNNESGTQSEVHKLEAKIDSLILLCKKLQDENQSLRNKQQNLVRDRAHLIEKTAVAKTRVEAMITRLRSMGH